MSSKRKVHKMQSKGQIMNVIHRIIELIARKIYLFMAFLRGPAETQPPLKDLTLLHSATTLAFKIRNKQVIIFPYFETNFL